MLKYGAAAKYNFDDPAKWVTQSAVPLLDEHVMTSETGKPVATVDRQALEQIAANNNRRVMETGDPATLILGHTSDDPRAPEKPSYGFVTNYRVLPYKRDPQTGRTIYAIHGDFKVRPKNAHILEQYPRRSVELWWHKKELDPIALLGGTSPERDLSVVIRNARLNHIALDHYPSSSPGVVRGVPGTSYSPDVVMYQRGAATIERYELEPYTYGKRTDKFGKVMKEFASGTLHSGSKKGPKVTSRKQAQAIAASEAGVSRHSRETDMSGRNGTPRRYESMRTGDDDSPGCHKYEEDGEPMQYEDAALDTYDGGEEAGGSDDGFEDDGPDNDPVVAKVMQSKWAKGIDERLNMILQALGGDSGGPPGGGEGAPPEEMPPPGPEGMAPGGDGMDAPGGDAPLPGGMDAPGGEPPMPDEEDTRRAHGGNPVQFSEGTSMAGPRSTSIPTVGKRYARPGQQQQRRGQQNPELVRMSRELNALKMENATNLATNAIAQLEREGVIFGDNPSEAQAAKDEQIQYCAYLYMRSKDDFNHEIEVMRKRYRRSRANPASPVSIGVARYAKDAQGQPPADEEYEPQNPREASDFADALTVHKMSRTEAIKFMRSKRAHYAQFDHEAQPGGDGFNG